jgi:cytochrome subunit of sulfide dehydrogenase
MPNRIAVFIANIFVFSTALAASPAVEDLVKPCAECHGTTGVSALPDTPHLDGQFAGYLMQELSSIASGERKTSVADHIAKTWSGKDITAVAKFYASSKATRPKQDTDAQKVAKGAEIYNQRCADCHVDNGRQSDKDAPLMAGQNLAYMNVQTKLYLQGKRRFPFMMDDAYKGLNADQLESVAHFFASQDQVRPRK